jgi:predicted RNase H-like HicB family nuclease
MREFTAVIEREVGGKYAVYVPDLPGVASMGDTKREALANITEAIACYVEGMKKLGKPLPRRRSRIELVRVKAA